jgi:hypothetical protein
MPRACGPRPFIDPNRPCDGRGPTDDRPRIQPRTALRIQTPCTKTWEQLSGCGAKRFCSECSLHVHDAKQLTREQAERLVAESTGALCMRMQFDPIGAPLFLDTPTRCIESEVTRSSVTARATRWAVLCRCRSRGPRALAPNPSTRRMARRSTRARLSPRPRWAGSPRPSEWAMSLPRPRRGRRFSAKWRPRLRKRRPREHK